MLHAGRVWAFYYIRLGPVARRLILGLPGLPRQLHAAPMLHAGRVWAFYYIRWGPELMVWINCGLDEALNTFKFYLCEVLSLLNEGMWCFFGLEDGLFEQLPIQQRTKRTSANWTIILLNIQLLNIHISRNYKTIVKKMNVEKLNVELTKCSIGILGNWLNGKRQMLNWLFVQYFLVNVTCSNAFGGSTGHRIADVNKDAISRLSVSGDNIACPMRTFCRNRRSALSSPNATVPHGLPLKSQSHLTRPVSARADFTAIS